MAEVVVLHVHKGSPRKLTDVPWIPFGTVTNRLLHAPGTVTELA